MPKRPDDDVDRARRLLLKAGLYAAPIVIDVVRVKTAHAQQNVSCAPFQCKPADTLCKPRS